MNELCENMYISRQQYHLFVVVFFNTVDNTNPDVYRRTVCF